MKTSIPCPSCQEAITLEDFEDFSSPFSMKCPHCRAKLKETRVTPFLLLGLIIVLPVFIYLTIFIKDLLIGFVPVVAKIPTMFVFLAFMYPLYAVYERMNGLIMFNKGNLQLKK